MRYHFTFPKTKKILAISNKKEASQAIAEHLFRYEYGKMVASLARIFGTDHLNIAEDIVQDTLLLALDKWRYQIPENPAGWLYQVAKNKAIDYIRRTRHFQKIATQIPSGFNPEGQLIPALEQVFLEHEIADSQLRMMFTVCHPALSVESQIALVLKTLSGFSIQEIARAFVTSEETIHKRLYRAREKIRQLQLSLEVPIGMELQERLESVLKAIYLLFNEGYNSTEGDEIIRRDLCFEAMRLCKLLTENNFTNLPETQALLALMCFHASRFDARLNQQGHIVLLKDQNRQIWDQALINLGVGYLACSAEGNHLTEYHVEARIAAAYCLSSTYEAIDWHEILNWYETLIKLKPTPMVQLNKLIVLGKTGKVQQAITELEALDDLQDHYLYHTALGALFIETQNWQKAHYHFQIAVQLTYAPAEKHLIQQKLAFVDAQKKS